MNTKRSRYVAMTAMLVLTALVITSIALFPTAPAGVAASAPSVSLNKRPVPNVDINLTAPVTRAATALQQQAAESFKASYGNKAVVRWNNFSGSPDVVMGFHTQPSTDTPENVARGFIQANSNL